jgi:dipeptidyl aminopeptidase/acylaminoacyl peptidase
VGEKGAGTEAERSGEFERRRENATLPPMRSRISFYSAAVLGCALSLSVCLAAQTVPAKHGITPDDLVKMARVGAPVVSPDGAWVAYTVSKVDARDDKNLTQLWMVSWDGKQDVQLTFSKDGAGEPQWSPDGKWLAFTTGREAEGPNAAKGSQVWVMDRRGGEAQQLTNVKQELEGYRWSPDSKTLLLTLQERDEPIQAPGAKPAPPKPIVIDRYHYKEDRVGFLTEKEPHLYLFDVETKKLSKLTNGPVDGPGSYGEESGTWSPDGTKVAFTSNQSKPDPDRVANPDVFVVEARAGATPKQLTTFAGTDSGPLVWSRDSTVIVYRQGTAPHYSIYDLRQLAMVPVAGGEPKFLAPKLDAWVGAPVLAPGGRAVLAAVPQDRDEWVGEISLNGGGNVARLTQGSGSASGLDQAGGHVALLWSTDAAPAEVYALEGEKLRKLTGHNDELLSTLEVAPTENIEAKTKDGSEVHGLLTMPVGYVAGSKAPMILFIHGGPTAQDQHGFDVSRQMFAAHGYAVLQVNYRGSTGRGQAYSAAINADWGDKEVTDLLALTDAAVATGKIDADKMGVGGWSYGGILTDYTIASTTRFKAASSGAGMGNLLGFYGIDQYILQYQDELGAPWKNLDLYVKLSYPFLHADRIKTPTLFMGGDKDFNVPVEGGEQMYQALRAVGTPAELIVYPGQFHGFTRPSFIKQRYESWFDWYDKYVRGMEPKPVEKKKAEEKKDKDED